MAGYPGLAPALLGVAVIVAVLAWPFIFRRRRRVVVPAAEAPAATPRANRTARVAAVPHPESEPGPEREPYGTAGAVTIEEHAADR